MAGALDWVRKCACLWVMVCGCGREAIEAEAQCETVSAGDVAISEIHANPDGGDGDGEYIELFNTSAEVVELDGLVLVSSRDDGSGAVEHRLRDAQISPGGYYVLGNAPPLELPPHLDYSYGSALGNLRNSDAALSLRCGDRTIDRVTYATTRDGQALELDGGSSPDSESNDDPDRWCFAQNDGVEVWPGNYGSPGAENRVCEAAEDEPSCNERVGGLGPPVEETIRITEWMANPRGTDGDFEWVEVFLSEAAELHGLRLGSSPDALRPPAFEESCFPVDAGTRVVFGAGPRAAPRVDAELDFSLGNGGTRSIVVAIGEHVLDRVDYDGSEEGQAWQLDAEGELCIVEPTSDNEYAEGNFGTPGQANPPCPTVLPEGMCFDGATPRPIRSPTAGQVRITEWMANPSKVDNRNGEWVEVELLAPMDLNGLVWSDLTATGRPLENDDCLAVEAGALLVFARSDDPGANGGVAPVAGELGVSLNNTVETISVGVGEEVLDTVSYSRPLAGVATQLDERGFSCEAITPYGDGDLGTPGEPNRACP